MGYKMVDLRSEQRKVKEERREHPRLEFHCDATVLGINGIQIITDISLGGVFIETSIPDNIKVGRTITISTKLPSDKNLIRLKAKVVNQRDRGIGCQFVNLSDQERYAICMCFTLFKDTLPAGCE